jgi:RNA polymerase sigma factor (sigma-70 family)
MAMANSHRETVSESTDPGIDWQAELARHDRWLRTVVAARLGNRDEVDEVMQEVSLAALAARSPVRDVERVAPWLYRVAVVQAILFRRKQGRARKLHAGFASSGPTFEDDPRQVDPLDWLLLHERQRLIETALKRIAPRDAEILLLKYTEGWNYSRIAAHLGIRTSAVESRLHRARARLRTELAPAQLIGYAP